MRVSSVYRTCALALFLVICFFGVVATPEITAAQSVNDLYSQAVRDYIEGDYTQSYEKLNDVLEKEPSHEAANNLLDSVKSELSKKKVEDERSSRSNEPDSDRSTEGDNRSNRVTNPVSGSDSAPEEEKASSDFSPLPEDERSKTSPVPPEISEDPTNTINHVNEDFETPEDVSTAIYGVTAKEFSDRTRIRIKASTPVGYIGSKIFNPPMVIMDFPKSVDRLPESPLPVELGRVIRARHSQYRHDPVETTRVVLDLDKWDERYRLYRSRDGKDVVLDVFEEETSLPPETPMVYRVDEIESPQSTTGARASLEKIRGDSQTVDLRTMASERLSLSLTDPSGEPLSGETVVFTLPRGGGSIVADGEEQSRLRTTTDNGGFARTQYRADTQAGVAVVKAELPHFDMSTKFRIKVKPGEPTQLVKVSGNRQSSLYGRTVSSPLVVEVRDRFGNPVPGLDLKFRDLSGKGMVDIHADKRGIQNQTKTDESGRVKVDFYRTAPDKDENHVVAATYREKDPELETMFTIFGQPQLITIDFKDANLQDVLRTLAQIADWNIAVTEETGGEAISEMSITVHLENVTALRALDTILDVKGLSRVSDGNVMKVVSKEDAIRKGVSVISPEDLEDYPANNIVTVAFKLRFLQATSQLASQLQSALLAENSSIVSDETSNSLIVTDLANNLRRLRRIINRIDQQDQLFQVRTFQLDQTDPQKLTEQIDQLLPTGEGQIVPFRPTNTMLVYADPTIMDQVEQIIEKIDNKNQLADNLKVIDVEGYDAEALAQRINSILGAQVIPLDEIQDLDFTFESAEDLQQIVSQSQETDIGKLVNTAKVVSLPKMQKIIVFGPKDIRETATQLIDELKFKSGEFVEKRNFTWLTIHNLPLPKARDFINRFGGITIHAGLEGRNAFLLSSENKETLERVDRLMDDIDRDINLEKNKDIVVYSPQFVSPQELGDQIDAYLQNLVQEESSGDAGFFQALFGGQTGGGSQKTRVLYSDENILVLAVEQWEADFVKRLLDKLDKGLKENQVTISYSPQYVSTQELVNTLTENNFGRIFYQDEDKFTLMVPKQQKSSLKSLIENIDSKETIYGVYQFQEEVPTDILQEIRQLASNAGLNASFIAVETSNQIFYTTHKKNEDQVREMIKSFDQAEFSTADVYKLKHFQLNSEEQVDDFEESLEALLEGGIGLESDGYGLVVHGPANAIQYWTSRAYMDDMRAAIATMDTNALDYRGREVVTYKPKYANPGRLAQILAQQNLADVLFSGGVRSQFGNKVIFFPKVDKSKVLSRLRAIDTNQTSTYTYNLDQKNAEDLINRLEQIAGDQGLGLNVNFTADPGGNRIYFSTSEKNRQKIRSLLDSLDKSGFTGNREILNFSPSYLDPGELQQPIEERNLGEVLTANSRKVSLLVAADRKSEVRKILKDIDNPSRTFNVVHLKRRKAGEEFVGNIEPVMENLGLNVTMTAEPRTNSILFTSPASSADRVEQMIRRLDKWQKQVLIKAVLVEVQLGEEEQLNPKWIVNPQSNNNQFVANPTGTQIDDDPGGVSFNFSNSNQFTALLNKGDFQSVFSWLRNNNKTDVITRPAITALNNQEAQLDLSQQRFFQQTSTDLETGQQQTEFVEQEAERTMNVQPTVTQGKNVILDVEITNDVFGTRAGENAPFPINTRSTENQILVDDKQTLMLGGIIQSNQTTNVDKIPFISSIPYIGNAFKSKTDSEQRTELIVFITPHVLTSPGDLGEATEETMEDMKNARSPEKIVKDENLGSGQNRNITLNDSVDTPKESSDETMRSEPASSDLEVAQDGDQKANLNRASKRQLENVVGSSFAELFVNERSQNGYFTSFNNLRNRLNLSEKEIRKLKTGYEVAVPRFNVNSVEKEKLRLLPNMTDKLAQNIVQYRFTQGKFRSLKELYQVFGMTEDKYKTLKPYLTVK